MSFAEDPEEGPKGLMLFLRDIGSATNDKDVIRATAKIVSGGELSKGLDAVRRYLVSNKVPTWSQSKLALAFSYVAPAPIYISRAHSCGLFMLCRCGLETAPSFI